MLVTKNADLSAYLARIRTQLAENEKAGSRDSMPNPQSPSTSTAAQNAAPIINLEYLKNCVLRFMVTSEGSERMRLAPVICALLSFSDNERENVNYILDQKYGSGSALAVIAAAAGTSHLKKKTSSDPSADALSSLYASMFGTKNSSHS